MYSSDSYPFKANDFRYQDLDDNNLDLDHSYDKGVQRSKKLHKLENDLMEVLIDPVDSESRKRHVKRLIYGEGFSIKKVFI
tara:strand:- start:99 stop:341 length:243 start_codon:yes stop_codon:yes gene_type:complete